MAAKPVIKAHRADFTFKAASLGTQELLVTGFEGSEGISELFNFRVELCSEVPDLDAAALVAQPAQLEIIGDSGTRYLNGIVRRFERVGEGSRHAYYVAEIVPALWLLTKRFQSRIFQEVRCPDMTLKGVLDKVLAEAGIPKDHYDPLVLNAAYEKREFVAQYRETDFDFISRLMEHEGAFYFFKHTGAGHSVVIADGASVHVDLPNQNTFLYRNPSGLVPESEHIFALRDRHEIQHGAVFIDDFNYRHAEEAMWMRGQKAGGQFTALIYNDYPGEFAEKADGGRYAQVRLEEYQAAARVLHMSATARGLMPGYRFTLADHPVSAANQSYLITHISHRARQPRPGDDGQAEQGIRYEAHLRAIPSSVPFRPPRKTPKPVIVGGQTAMVVGPDGEEIFTDEDGYGRVKVQFHWDRSGSFPRNGSAWVRVSQAWAGGGYGMLFMPRVGQEVIVDFLEGNPDRPIVTGRVYNHDNMPPFVKDKKTRSTIKTNSSKGGEGSNEISFEDLKGEEKLFFHAQKDLHIRVRNDHVENVERDLHLTVANNMHELVRADRALMVEGNLNEEIKTDVSTNVKGKESKSIDGTLSLTVKGDVVEDFKANHKQEVAQTLTLKGMNVKIEGVTQLDLVVGGCSIQLAAAGVFVNGLPLLNLNSGNMPPVMPVAAIATTPTAPVAPIDADTADLGKDVTYAPEDSEFDRVNVAALAAESDQEPPAEPKKLTWIEILLVNDADQPVPSEPYEIKLPNGKLRKGTLDANGRARVEGIEPGTCQICFPNLDAEAWERI